ncbi:MAG: PilN domain-containing protein [Thermodesulfovibrionales bacterium]
MSNILDLHILRNRLHCRIDKKGLLGSKTIKKLDIPLAFNDVNRKEIVTTLSDLKKEYGVKNTRVYLPFFLCLFSIIDLPLKKTGDVKDALPFELAGSLPLPIDEYIYDFDIIDRSEMSSKVMALSVKKDLISDISLCIHEAGLAISTIRFDLMEKLSSVCSVRKKESFIFVDHSPEDIYIATVIKGICSSLKRVSNSDLLKSEIENIRNLNQVRDVFLVGAVTDEIRKEIGVSTVDKQKQKKPIAFSSPYRFDFFKPELSEEYRARQRKYVLWTALLSGVFIIAGFIFPVYRDYARLKNVSKEIRGIKSEASELLNKSKKLDDSRRKLTFLKKRQINSKLHIQVLAEITGILPADSWIMSFNIDEKGFIELKGFADDATKMVEILEESEMFRNAGFSGPMLKSGDKTRYSVKMELER